MMAGEARRQAAGSAKRYQVLDKHGLPKWHAIWQGHPNIATPGEPYHERLSGYFNRLRPYLESTTPQRYLFRPYEPAPAPLYLDERARSLAARARGAIVFNPTIKMRASPNKAWGLGRWKALIARGIGLKWIQVGEVNVELRGAEYVPTPTFLEACGVLSGARAAVLHEGALHHAAAALGVPAVVIRGGFISPRVTGYAGQKDLYVEDARWPLGCGHREACKHCAAAMESITPEAVLGALHELLRARVAA